MKYKYISSTKNKQTSLWREALHIATPNFVFKSHAE